MAKNLANSVMLQQPDKSRHDLTCSTKTTTKMGRLTPVYCQEVVPGDVFNINAEFLTKLQPLGTPALQNMYAHVHYFYVPWRILWNNWKYYIAQIPQPGQSVPPIHPYSYMDGSSAQGWELTRYFGIESEVEYCNILPMLAYQLIYNEYYRHEKIHEDLTSKLQTLTDGDNLANAYLPEFMKIRYRTFKDDYFTAALPSPQDGTAATTSLISLTPLEVHRNDTATGTVDFYGSPTSGGSPTYRTQIDNKVQGGGSGPIAPYQLWVDPSEANISINMNQLIELQRMQEFLVRSNLAGNRYNEFILAHFGIRVPDLRIDRPDYICGMKAPILISELLNVGNEADQGKQTGQGNGYSDGASGKYEISEHGIILGIYSCIPTQSYTTAVQKLFFKRDAEQFYLPIFDQMGEQEIENRELILNHNDPFGTFGYVPRYAEYRLPFDMVTGEFRNTLRDWHCGLIPPVDVVLDADFFDIKSTGANGINRIFSVNDDEVDDIMVYVVNHIDALRPMKMYSMLVLSNNYGNNIS